MFRQWKRRRDGRATAAQADSKVPLGWWPYPASPSLHLTNAGRGELAGLAENLIHRFRAGGYRDGVQRVSGSLDELAWQLEEITLAFKTIDPVAGERSFAVWSEVETINALNLNDGAEVAVDRTELDELLDTYMSILHTNHVS